MPLIPDEFRAKYPLILAWISQTLAAHAPRAEPVMNRNFPRLGRYFSRRLLASAKVVTIDRLPVPPVGDWGLTQFAEWAGGEYGGITYLDTFFVTPGERANESLHFHELVHVVQWTVLGIARFVAAYAGGLEKFGYRKSPLEAMAYELEDRFKSSPVAFDAERAVSAKLAELA